jgi:hypothetical protein
MERTRVTMDLEFTQLQKKTTPISIGLKAQNGAIFYGEFTDYDRDQLNDFLNKNVIPNLKFANSSQYYSESTNEKDNDTNENVHILSIEVSGTKDMVTRQLKRWLSQFEAIELWGDVLGFDWVVFVDLFGGTAFDIPENIYYIPFDISTLFYMWGIDPDISREEFADMKSGEAAKHNSLWDAEVTMACLNKLLGLVGHMEVKPTGSKDPMRECVVLFKQ